MAYAALLADLFGRNARGMKLGLGPMASLLERLGAPHRNLPVVIVAGTNGKGSVSHLTAHALMRAGHRVGLFTSPHLMQFAERIQIDGVPVTQAQIATYYQALCRAERGLLRPATFFESALALAYLAFFDAKVDVCVLEVGMGGRLDAVNTAPDAMRLATVITPIALDHQAHLGGTLAAIAQEKLAIARPHVPLCSAHQADEVAPLVRAHASALHAPLLWPHDDATLTALGAPWVPRYRRQNIALVAAVLDALGPQGLPTTAAHLKSAVAQAQWPGRYHYLARTGGPDVLLDCAHNVAGARALAEALSSDPRLAHRRTIAIVGAVVDKDLPQMIAQLRCSVDAIHVTTVPSSRSYTAAMLAHDTFGLMIHDDFATAYAHVCAQVKNDDVVVVAGSIYLVGHALAHFSGATCDPTL